MATQSGGAPRHRAQELMLEGLRTLRTEIPEDAVDQSTIDAIEECIESLVPMRGFGVPNATARLGALAYALEVLAFGLIPHVTVEDSTPLAPIAAACARAAEQLKTQSSSS